MICTHTYPWLIQRYFLIKFAYLVPVCGFWSHALVVLFIISSSFCGTADECSPLAWCSLLWVNSKKKFGVRCQDTASIQSLHTCAAISDIWVSQSHCNQCRVGLSFSIDSMWVSVLWSVPVDHPWLFYILMMLPLSADMLENVSFKIQSLRWD